MTHLILRILVAFSCKGKSIRIQYDNIIEQFQVQPGGQNKQMMDDINRLTAQTIAAEEAIAYRDDQIKKLKDENLKMKDEIDNTVPILKAQVGD